MEERSWLLLSSLSVEMLLVGRHQTMMMMMMMLQMMMLEPRFCVMDETDSGLDIDALKVVASGVNSMRSPERGFLVITHYQRLLDYIEPDHVHVLADGQIVRSGSKELALELEKRGYDFLKDEVEVAG